MYLYDPIDQQLVDDRVAQFRRQTERFLAGALSEDDFRPLRLQNGLYIQRYAPMLRQTLVNYDHSAKPGISRFFEQSSTESRFGTLVSSM